MSAGIKWYRCEEGHLGGDIIKPNLVAQECLPLFVLCGTEDAGERVATGQRQITYSLRNNQ